MGGEVVNLKNDIWIVLGHNREGSFNYDPTILGIYPTKNLARQRIDKLKKTNAPWEIILGSCFQTEHWGSDLNILIR